MAPDMNGEKTAVYPQDFVKLKSPSGSEDVHYSLFYEGLPEEYRLLAQKDLNETEENKEKGLKKLKALMEKEKLPSCTDHDLIGVLRCSKYNMKKAESRLKKYLKFRERTKQLLASMDESKTELILEDAMFSYLPYRDKHGRLILVTRPNINMDLYQMEEIQPIAFASLLYLYSFPLTTVCGLSYIMEMKADNLYIYYHILRAFRAYVNAFVEFPLRYGRIDGVNENRLTTLFYTAIRPILPEKIKNRVAFHGKGYESLKNIYSPDLLPEEFEGKLGLISNNFFKKGLLDFIKKLKAEN